MKILIVEDEVIIADNLYNQLQRMGYDPLPPAITYTQAIRLMEKHQPDFAILDIYLGGSKTGVDVAHIINEQYAFPFIFLTAFGDDDTLKNAVTARPAAYLVKPFDKSEVKPTIEIACMNFKLRQQTTPVNHIDQLTQAERRVINLIAQNKTTTQIAADLFISISTVKNHRHRICSKLELPPSNNALLTWVMQNWQVE